jgi:DNA-binding MarR family transcriptional regulator
MKGSWSFLTNHALVLVYVVMHPDSTVREIAAGIGVTERATLAIIRELEDEGIVERHRDGRRNRYAVNFAALLSYRREATAGFTPAPFVAAMVFTLAKLVRERSIAAPYPPEPLPIRTGSWGFFTNHLVILLAVAMDSTGTVRDLASRSGVTERAAITILKQLHEDGVIVKVREGRRNSYEINYDEFGRHVGRSGGTWELPEPLIDAARAALQQLMASGAPPLPAERVGEPEGAVV